MIKRLSAADIKKRLKALPGWKHSPKARAIHTEIKCKNFVAAVRLIGKIAKLAEAANHHPDLHLTHYRRLKIILTTHEAGGVTERDFRLASDLLAHLR